MTQSNAEHFFDRSYPHANRMIMKVAEAPADEAALLPLLENAMRRGFDTRAPLKEIHLPLERFPSIDSKFWHIPVEDCGGARILRFIFEMPDDDGAH